MSRHYLSTTSLALVLGVSLTVPGSAQEGQVPFCAVDETERNFPCRGANSEVVQDNDALMTTGGGVPEPGQIDEEMAAGAVDAQPETEMSVEQGAAEEAAPEGDLQAQLEADAQQETDPAAEVEAQAEQSGDDPLDAQTEPGAQAQDVASEAEPEAQAEQTADDEVAADSQDELDAQAQDAASEAEPEAQAEQTADDEVAADSQGELDAEVQQRATDDADLKAQMEAEEQARQDTEDRTQQETAVEATPEEDEQTAVPAQSEADAQADATAPEGVEGGAQPDAEAQAERDTQAQQSAEDEADLKARLEAEEQARQEAEANAEQDAQDQPQDTDAQADAGIDQQTEEEAQAQAEEEAERAARRAERRSERRAAAAAAEESDAAEIEKETIDEADVRSADEEFDTNVAATGQTIDAPKAKKDDGMSKFEKALLLGLGAAVVGTVLSNGDEVVSNSGDRVVVRRDGELAVLKNDDALLRRPGSEIGTQSFSDGSTRTTVSNADGSRIVTIRDADGSVLRRSRILANGQEYLLFDDTRPVEPVSVADLPQIDTSRTAFVATPGDDAALSRALDAELRGNVGRNFSLEQVRSIRQVRELAPQIEVDAITFATGSAAISPDKARELANLGRAISDLVRRQPETVILVEGHTDAVGDDSYNLALSDRRAETVALALTQYFDVPPENMVTQGFGERYLKVQTQKAEPTNRRAVVRNITRLLQ